MSELALYIVVPGREHRTQLEVTEVDGTHIHATVPKTYAHATYARVMIAHDDQDVWESDPIGGIFPRDTVSVPRWLSMTTNTGFMVEFDMADPTVFQLPAEWPT